RNFEPLSDSKLGLKFVRIGNLLTLPLETEGKISSRLNVWSHDLVQALGGRQSRRLWEREIKPGNHPKTQATPKDLRGFYHSKTFSYLNVLGTMNPSRLISFLLIMAGPSCAASPESPWSKFSRSTGLLDGLLTIAGVRKDVAPIIICPSSSGGAGYISAARAIAASRGVEIY